MIEDFEDEDPRPAVIEATLANLIGYKVEGIKIEKNNLGYPQLVLCLGDAVLTIEPGSARSDDLYIAFADITGRATVTIDQYDQKMSIGNTEIQP